MLEPIEPVQRGISGDSVVFGKESCPITASGGDWWVSEKERGGKKRARVRAAEREGGKQWMRGGRGRLLLLLFEKGRKKKVARCSHRKTLRLEEAQGSCASHKRPICQSLPALSQKSPLQIVSVEPKDNETADLSAHTPRGLQLFFSPPMSLSSFCCAHFFHPHHKPYFFLVLFCFLLWALGQRWISFCHRRTSEGRHGGS